MGSTALAAWTTTATARFDQLLAMHLQATGDKPGRRWGTTQFNRGLMVILVSQFQAYCRDLHDCAVREHVKAAVAGQKQLLEVRLTEGRKLDVGNPRRAALGADFGHLGFSLIDQLKSTRSDAEADLEDLDTLVDFRNAVAHANETLIAEIEGANRIRATKSHFVSNRKTLDRLAHTMDRVVANKISALLEIPVPW